MTQYYSYLIGVGWTILYLIYIWLFGTRIIILLTGIGIILLFNYHSLKQYLLTELASSNLLNTRNFRHHFRSTKRLLIKHDCLEEIATVLETQQLAKAIALLQPTSIPELLSILHDVLSDAAKIAQASKIAQQPNDANSQLIARQHLNNYQLQLQRRHQQLQQLKQQIQLNRL